MNLRIINFLNILRLYLLHGSKTVDILEKGIRFYRTPYNVTSKNLYHILKEYDFGEYRLNVNVNPFPFTFFNNFMTITARNPEHIKLKDLYGNVNYFTISINNPSYFTDECRFGYTKVVCNYYSGAFDWYELSLDEFLNESPKNFQEFIIFNLNLFK